MNGKTVSVTDAKNRLPELLKEAQQAPISVTRHGEICGVIHGFANEDDFLEWRIRNDKELIRRFERAKEEFETGSRFLNSRQAK